MTVQESTRPSAISIFGLGYVGSVTAACLARLGHRITGVDLNPLKVDLINAGCSPILEPGMAELVAEGHRSGRLHATTDATAAVARTDLSFIAVGTPNSRNGKPDLSAIGRVSEQIGQAMKEKDSYHWIAVRSTVLPGTTDTVIAPALERASGKRAGSDFAVCSNPEFLREGSAIADFLEPTLTVLGAENRDHLALLRALYQKMPGRIVETSLRTAEMVKYVSNAFHAVKVDFANEIGALCQHLGVCADQVMEIFCSDTKLNISPAYLKPGFAFGGSCLPKDTRALVHCAKQLDLHLALLEAILPSNAAHLERAIELILATGRKKVGLLGLSFKSGTDDLRESPLLLLVKRLLGEGCQILIYDPSVSWSCLHGANRQFAEAEIPHIASLLRSGLEDIVKHAQVLVVGNRDPEYARISSLARPGQLVLDLAHLPGLPADVLGLCW